MSTLSNMEYQISDEAKKKSPNSKPSIINPPTPRRAISTIALNYSHAGSLSTSSGTDSLKRMTMFHHNNFKKCQGSKVIQLLKPNS